MRKYELVLVSRSSLSEAQRKKLLETAESWLKPARNASQRDAGGGVKIEKKEEWGQKPLSYSIKRETTGFYTLLRLESESSIPLDLEKRIHANDNIIRHLLIRTK